MGKVIKPNDGQDWAAAACFSSEMYNSCEKDQILRVLYVHMLVPMPAHSMHQLHLSQ